MGIDSFNERSDMRASTEEKIGYDFSRRKSNNGQMEEQNIKTMKTNREL